MVAAVAHVPSDISSPPPPPPCPVPHFSPVRVSGGHRGLRRLLRHRRRAMAAGLAVTAAALVAAGPRHAEQAPSQGHPAAAAAPSRAGTERPRAAALVTAPVRIADAETVRLLHRGDRVDVVASDGSASRVVAAGARVTEVPGPQEGAAESAAEPGALVVLSVPRATAARLAGAGAGMRLAVTLC
ncbi:hypothetical protein AB0E78_15795 [Streptomyces sp. NPDC032198]|uniref:hypothetical protein n=1 Tax=Streptomyces sp. NPDC032198 TaxID=3155127 RepID=UPI0033F8CC50